VKIAGLKRFAIDIDAAIDWHAQFPPKALCSRKIVNFQDGKKVDKLDNSKPVWSEGSKRLRSSKTRKSLSDTSTSQESEESNESEKTWPVAIPNPPVIIDYTNTTSYPMGDESGMYQHPPICRYHCDSTLL